MRLLPAVALIALSLPGASTAQQCVLSGADVKLTAEALGRIGFKPEGEMFKFVEFTDLKVIFGEPSNLQVPINEHGDTVAVSLVPVTIDIQGKVNSARERFLREVGSQLPRPGKNDSIGVTGGFMRIHNPTTIRLSGNIRAVDNSSKVKWWRQGKSSTPVWLDIALVREDANADLKLDASFDTGNTSATTPFSVIIDAIALPATFVSGIFDWDTLGTQLDDKIGRDIDQRIAQEKEAIKPYVDKMFDIRSINNLVSDAALLFATVYKNRLKFTQLTGFTGTNPEPIRVLGLELPSPEDADVIIRLNKSSVPEDAATHLSNKTACQLQSDLNLLKRLVAELNGAPPRKHTVASGESLHSISENLFGDSRFVMTIAQKNNMVNPDVLAVGQELEIPQVEALTDPNARFVAVDDSVWSIVGTNYGDHSRMSQVIERNVFPSGPDLIYPGMLVDPE